MMEERKLTKDDIDRVRGIEGFPIAKDEDIIALSRPPYYTACPNPFIEDFIREHGTPYDEETDSYHREPFAADVNEGKYDPLYKLHSYPTKVPHKAIMQYILHYTEPGDVVLDCFCGTGMTGLAAQSCGLDDKELMLQYASPETNRKWGVRKAILCDLSPTATYIASNYNSKINVHEFLSLARGILSDCEKEYGWMDKTAHSFGSAEESRGKIEYTVWSRICICPSCSKKINLWENSVDYDFQKSIGEAKKKFACPHCGALLDIASMDTSIISEYDDVLGRPINIIEQVPVLINYSYNGKRYEKVPDHEDLLHIDKVKQISFKYFVPHSEIPYMHQTHQRNNLAALGITHEHHLYTRKTMMIYSYLFNRAEELQTGYRNRFMFLLSACFNRTTRLVRYMAQHKEKNVGPLSGTLYFPPIFGEINVLKNIQSRLKKMEAAYKVDSVDEFNNDYFIMSTQSAENIEIPENSVDYIFVDPPFGENLMYSELNYFTDMWLRVYGANQSEAIINKAQGKGLSEYQQLMSKCFYEMYRVLKPHRWITIEFHNSQNSVWNALQEALQAAGFIIADVRTLDKGKGTTKQLIYSSAVKQDLVISAYKPKESFVRQFTEHAGDPEMAWEFVRQHLQNVPVAPDSTGKIEVVSERQDYLLFDRMVAFHIMNGIPVPVDSHAFYAGLRERFIARDGMYFLPDQVNEYDERRQELELHDEQLSLFIIDEKSAIIWLNAQLSHARQTYSDIQPKFLQDWHRSKFEQMPELLDMLKENFLQDDDSKWYVPNLSDKADLEKLRRKRLLKDFYDIYAKGTGRIKNARTEAIRVGFDECWKERNYSLIVKVGDRLPETVLQEDPALLMYYDNAANRM